MICQWEKIGEAADGNLFVCRRCSLALHPTPHAAAMVYAECRVDRRDYQLCLHRGEETRRQKCRTCSGTTQIKIFACSIHGECQLANKIPGVKFCGTCQDFAAGPAQ